jgi:acetyl-CoA/propionyl-CoA carboxylase carboxyl transferase subunit
MNFRSLGATKVVAWPAAEIAVMGPVAPIRILHRRERNEVRGGMLAQVEADLAAEHERIAGGVDKAVEIGVVDEIISPEATRSRLAAAIRDADTGVRGAHGNIPL